MSEALRIQREAQRAQKLQTETNFMGAHQLNQQTDAKTAAESLGKWAAAAAPEQERTDPGSTLCYYGRRRSSGMAGMMGNMMWV